MPIKIWGDVGETLIHPQVENPSEQCWQWYKISIGSYHFAVEETGTQAQHRVNGHSDKESMQKRPINEVFSQEQAT